MAVNVKVGLIGPLDILKFKNMSKVREDYIQAAPAREITADYKINQKAKLLHPDFQKLVIAEIIDHPEAASKTYIFKAADGGSLAYFRAGQYISLKLKIGESFVSRPYSICSAPKDALEGTLAITIQSKADGFAADYFLANAAVGDEFTASGPQGNFYYEDLRDAPNVIALAGECGWCRSKVISGDYFAPEENESRRYSDRVTDNIHPCVTFPVGDMVIEVPAEYV